MKSSLAQLLSAVKGARMTVDAAFDGVSTDSRGVAAGNLFVASVSYTHLTLPTNREVSISGVAV